MPIETLQCSHGHSFTRTRVRGKKPTRCPDHRGILSPSANSNSPGQGNLPENNGRGSGGLSQPHSMVSEAMLEVLTSDRRLEREWLKKADYVVGQLDDPKILARRDPNDLAMLEKVQKDLVRQVLRAVA